MLQGVQLNGAKHQATAAWCAGVIGIRASCVLNWRPPMLLSSCSYQVVIAQACAEVVVMLSNLGPDCGMMSTEH